MKTIVLTEVNSEKSAKERTEITNSGKHYRLARGPSRRNRQRNQVKKGMKYLRQTRT